jgi:tetratricopeptide (TPR) repeat protein
LLDDPRFVNAVRSRDFGAVFDMAHNAGISYKRIAEACRLKADRVGQMARGTDIAITTIAAIERIADGLRIPGGLLGLAARPWEKDQPDYGDDPMKRRQLLRGALAAGITSTALTAITTTRESVDQTLDVASTADLTDLEDAAEAYGYGYGGQPPARVLADLVTDFGELRPLLAVPQPVATRARVCRTAGQMASMTAIVLHDLGQRREARSWFRTAARAAAESGDRQLHAWVLAREAMVPLNYGAPQAAARLAEEARRIAGSRPTPASALAAAVAARSYALAHEGEKAWESLVAAEAAMERLGAEERRDTWLTYPEQKHHVHLSQALTILGDTRRARESQTRALELSAPTSSMTRTLLLIDGATCAHQEGDSEEACRRTVAALSALPDSYRTGLVRQRALDLYTSIPAPQHGERAVRELSELLAA